MHNIRKLTVLSCGAGRDSCAIIAKHLSGEYQIPGEFVAVFSDTGNEHPHTYETITRVKALCAEKGVKFVHLTPDLGYHTEAWRTLTGQWSRTNSVTSKAFGKACTDNLKIKPIYRWLNDYCGELLGIPKDQRQDRGKQEIVEWVSRYGQIDMIVGIAQGEEKRLGKDFPQKWATACINRIYPLIDWGMNGNDCIEYLDSYQRLGKVYPSNCMFCHYSSKAEVLWLYRQYPEKFSEWVGYEKAKIDANREKQAARGKPNHGVNGAKLLPVILLEAEEEFGHLGNEDLDDIKRSHGQCGVNAY